MNRYYLSGKNYDFLVFIFVIWIVGGNKARGKAGVKTFQTWGVLGRLR